MTKKPCGVFALQGRFFYERLAKQPLKNLIGERGRENGENSHQ